MADMAARCTSCGECVRPCLFLQQHGTPAVIARNGASAENLTKAYGCSLCGLCDAVCPEGLEPSAMFLAMRQEAVSRNQTDITPYAPWLKYEKTGASYFFRRDLIPEGCRTVLFPGCSLPGARPEAVIMLLHRLRQQEPDAGLVLDCCGKISHDLGMKQQFNELFVKLTRRLKAHGIQRILTSCPGCSKILSRYGDGFEVTSIYEQLVAPGYPTTNADAPHNAVVTIHDPCPSRFDAVQQQAIRSLVKSHGYKIEELPSSGRLTRCCGQGGMVEGCVPGTVKRETGQLADEAAGRTVITSCGSCCETLAAGTPTIHVADLLNGGSINPRPPATSAKRWLNRLKLRFARL